MRGQCDRHAVKLHGCRTGGHAWLYEEGAVWSCALGCEALEVVPNVGNQVGTLVQARERTEGLLIAGDAQPATAITVGKRCVDHLTHQRQATLAANTFALYTS